MVDIDIREALVVDKDDICAFLAPHHMMTEGVLAPGTRYWMALYQQRCVGVIGAEYGDHSVLMRSVLVAADMRSHGIAARLTQHLFRSVASSGYTCLYCFSTGAGAYWQKHGFYEVPVDEVVRAHPTAPQVIHYREQGWLPTEVTWRKDLP